MKNWLKRTWLELLILVIMFIVASILSMAIFPYGLAEEMVGRYLQLTWVKKLMVANAGLFSLSLTKIICISAGILHAHVSRKLIFPYIDFKEETKWDNNLMIIVWYAIIIWGWVRGG